MKVLLINITPDGKTKDVPVTHERTVIGRLDDCQIRIPSGRVSRHHCEIVLKDGDLVLSDLDSSNGTYLNQSKIDGPKTLSAGDLLAVGSLVFLVQIDGEPSDYDPEFLYEDGVPDEPAAQKAPSQSTAKTVSEQPPTAPASDAPTNANDGSSMMDFNFDFDLDDDESLEEQPPL